MLLRLRQILRRDCHENWNISCVLQISWSLSEIRDNCMHRGLTSLTRIMRISWVYEPTWAAAAVVDDVWRTRRKTYFFLCVVCEAKMSNELLADASTTVWILMCARAIFFSAFELLTYNTSAAARLVVCYVAMSHVNSNVFFCSRCRACIQSYEYAGMCEYDVC